MLTWKKRKDGSLIARAGKEVYTVHRLPPKGVRVYPIFRLGKDNKRLYDAKGDSGKEVCKRVAGRLHSGVKSAYDTVRTKLSKDLVDAFEYHVEVFYTKYVPRTGKDYCPDKGMFLAAAKAGKSPWLLVNTTDGLYDNYRPDFLDALSLELFPVWYREEVELAKAKAAAKAKQDEEDKKANAGYFAQTASAAKSPVKVGKYSGPEPESRESKRRPLSVPTVYAPVPFKPEDAKFATLYKWAERVRDWWEVRGRFATYEYLSYAARYCCFQSFDRGTLAADRMALIYRQEAGRRQAANQARMAVAGRKEAPGETPAKKAPGKLAPERKKVEKDGWGFKKTTRAAAVNAVLTKEPKTLKRIERESKATSVSSHLARLVRDKKLKRVGKDQYRLRKGVKPANS